LKKLNSQKTFSYYKSHAGLEYSSVVECSAQHVHVHGSMSSTRQKIYNTKVTLNLMVKDWILSLLIRNTRMSFVSISTQHYTGGFSHSYWVRKRKAHIDWKGKSKNISFCR
jgi:hypothetical protein